MECINALEADGIHIGLTPQVIRRLKARMLAFILLWLRMKRIRKKRNNK